MGYIFLNEIAIFRFSNYHFVISKYLFPHISPVSTCFANIILSAIAPVLMKQRQSAINRSYTLFIYSRVLKTTRMCLHRMDGKRFSLYLWMEMFLQWYEKPLPINCINICKNHAKWSSHIEQ